MYKNLDDVAASVSGYKINTHKPKFKRTYYQNMQSRFGSRNFVLRTTSLGNGKLEISLLEGSISIESRLIGSRSAKFNDEESIHKAIKSLERKAKCRLYYVLLISTDGEYL